MTSATEKQVSPIEPTREAGLNRLQEFVPEVGRAYAQQRNFDLGPDKRQNVSGLSPYIGQRLITESEVVAAVLAGCSTRDAESFLQEMGRRTYWKGWLEGRPQVYTSWRRLVAEDLKRWPERKDYQAAVSGETGIEAFDAWVKELKAYGTLHHQARLSFASIWIFTLKLPWSLGAAFFFDHLLDGDSAVNTLSWRWVAGLQTKGKHHLATSEGIRRLSKGRFDCGDRLQENARPLAGPASPHYAPPIPFPFQASEQLGEDYALLITGDDLLSETGFTGTTKPKLIVSLDPEELDASYHFTPQVMDFKRRAMDDSGRRAEEHFQVARQVLTLGRDPAAALAEVMKSQGLTNLLYYEPFVGPWKELTDRLTSRDVGVRFFPLRRPWDGLLHPHAAKSYVHFKKHALPQIVRAKGSFDRAAHKTV